MLIHISTGNLYRGIAGSMQVPWGLQYKSEQTKVSIYKINQITVQKTYTWNILWGGSAAGSLEKSKIKN